MNRYDLVLLGFLLEKDRCGYDLITIIKDRDMHRWAKISVSTVYNRLARLETKGYIQGRSERDGNRPERTTYTITDDGRRLLREEVLRHLTGFNDDPRTLGYAFLFAANPEKIVETLQDHKKSLEKEIEVLNKVINEEPKPTFFPEGPFLNCMSRDHILVELKYVNAAIEICSDPEKMKRLNGYFFINFGGRDTSSWD
jgi:DNA-binding PadR family transcriptional regulator